MDVDVDVDVSVVVNVHVHVHVEHPAVPSSRLAYRLTSQSMIACTSASLRRSAENAGMYSPRLP